MKLNKATIDIAVRTLEAAVCIFDLGLGFYSINKQERDKEELIEYCKELTELQARSVYLENIKEQQEYIDDKITKVVSIHAKYGAFKK